MLIAKIRTALDRAVNFNERVNAFTLQLGEHYAEYYHQRRHTADMPACI